MKGPEKSNRLTLHQTLKESDKLLLIHLEILWGIKKESKTQQRQRDTPLGKDVKRKSDALLVEM